MKKETELRIKDDSLILELNAFGEYEDVEVIGEILVKYFHAKIIKKLDGPSNRVWFIEIRKSEFQLHQVEGYGCFLKADTEESKLVLREIDAHWSLYS
jgi:hypothetical protein